MDKVVAVRTLAWTATLLYYSLQSARLLHQQPVRARVVALPDVSAGVRSGVPVCMQGPTILGLACSSSQRTVLVFDPMSQRNADMEEDWQSKFTQRVADLQISPDLLHGQCSRAWADQTAAGLAGICFDLCCGLKPTQRRLRIPVTKNAAFSRTQIFISVVHVEMKQNNLTKMCCGANSLHICYLRTGNTPHCFAVLVPPRARGRGNLAHARASNRTFHVEQTIQRESGQGFPTCNGFERCRKPSTVWRKCEGQILLGQPLGMRGCCREALFTLEDPGG